MYMPHDIQRTYAIEPTTPSDQRAIDQQVGKVAAAVSTFSRRITGRARRSGQPLPQRSEFRKVGVNSPC